MNNKTKTPFMLRCLFGPDYLTDERIQSGIDQAGNYTFVLTMILLWAAMAIGLITDQIKLTVVPFIIFLLSSIFYLVFRIKNGSLQAAPNKKQSRLKILSSWVLIGIVYAAIMFLFRIKDIEAFTVSNISHSILFCIINAILFVFVFIFFGRFLIKRNDRVLNKKMDNSD